MKKLLWLIMFVGFADLTIMPIICPLRASLLMVSGVYLIFFATYYLKLDRLDVGAYNARRK